MSEVIIVSGPPGAGKSTIGRELARRWDRSVHLHTDDFWHNIFKGAIAPYLPEADDQNRTVVAITAGAAFGYAAGGFTTLVDGVVGPWMLHHYLRLARRHPDVGLQYVVLRPDLETALSRARSRTGPDSLTDEVPITAMWEQFADLGEFARCAVDTTDLDVATTVDAVHSALIDGRYRLEV